MAVAVACVKGIDSKKDCDSIIFGSMLYTANILSDLTNDVRTRP